EIVDPCVLGTLNVLNAWKQSTTVKRVVCTSSVASVSARNDLMNRFLFPQARKNEFLQVFQVQMWYGLGKTLPEQAALEFGKENGIEVITIAPSVVGELLSSKATPPHALPIFSDCDHGNCFDQAGYVHLDDVAQAHLPAYTHPKGTGRYVCAINMSYR
ncbi:hypothetical protein SELMODRAFT_36792, partial [Selaginella moellendorffii]